MRTIITMLRLPNLLIIALTFFILRYLVFIPVYSAYSLMPGMGNLYYSFLIIATMLIAASGYMANDYFDVLTDSVNKPEKQYIGKLVMPGTALATAIMFGSVSVLLALWLSVELANWLPLAFLLTALLVAWWYAMSLKKSFLWGNIAVSCMSAGTIAMAWIIESQCLTIPVGASERITGIIVTISVFAFILSMQREIVKDMEDLEGDKLIQCRSLPIVKGLPFTKKVLILLVAITFVLLVIAQIYLVQFLKVLAAIWLFLAVEVPLVYFLLKLQKAQSKTDFHSLSSMLKLIMAGGIASIIAGQF